MSGNIGLLAAGVGWLLAGLAGCGGDAGMELAASDALVAVADQVQLTVQEYHDEVTRFDDSREDGMVGAFVARVQSDRNDSAGSEKNVTDFRAAMRKVRQDRETEWQRRSASMDNVDVLREMAKGMQRLALDSLSLRDEMRRYVEGWIANQRRANGPAGATTGKAISGGKKNGS